MGKSVYLIAAAITVFVFVSVFLFVKMDESAKFGELSDEIMALYEEQQANKILKAYLDEADEESCVIYERQISRQLSRIYTLFSKLELVKDTTFATSAESVKRQYLLTSMSLWIDLKETSKICDLKIKPVLYFFPDTWHPPYGMQENTCLECDAMVEQLKILKSDCHETRVFAFPAESENFEFVELLKKEYNVSSAPALVINDHVVYSVTPMQQLKEWLECT